MAGHFTDDRPSGEQLVLSPVRFQADSLNRGICSAIFHEGKLNGKEATKNRNNCSRHFFYDNMFNIFTYKL